MRATNEPVCDLCGSSGSVAHENVIDSLHRAPGVYTIRLCQNPECATLWLDPRPIEEDIHAAYQDYYTHTGTSSLHRTSSDFSFLRPAHRAWMALLGLPRQQEYLECMGLNELTPGSVLDIGCGNGARLARLRAIGWEVQGQDVDSITTAYATTSLGIPVFLGELSDAGFTDGQFDAVIANHVLEHVHKPQALLAEAYKLLRPGGVLMMTTPNAKSLGYRKFGRDWRGLEVPRHIRVLAPGSLAALARRAGIDAPKVWTSAARAERIARGSYAIRSKRLLKNGESVSPGIVRVMKTHIFTTRAMIMHHWKPDSGEECILWAQKPEG